jgi:AhpD family alkylhydroperoxidase
MTQRLDHQVVSPDGMRSLGSVYQYVTKSGLPPSLVNLIFLRVSQINGCAYCIAMHSRDLLNNEMAVEKLMLLSAWREAKDLFSNKERAALQWAESVTLIYETGAPDMDYQVVATQFNEKELVDLTIAIGLINVYNRLSIGFRRAPEAVVSA